MRHILSFGILLAAVGSASMAQAEEKRPSLQNSFPLGAGGGVLCQVQSKNPDPALKNMFDRAYSIVCRDAAVAIGRIYALRSGGEDPLARVTALRGDQIVCGAPRNSSLPDLPAISLTDCAMKDVDVGYRSYAFTKGKTVYIAEGLAGYDSALQLGLRTIVADRIIPGEISVATSAVSDPAAFARVQAGSLDLDSALAEGYRRNNSGSYAEAAEFFDTLLQRTAADAQQKKLGEYVVNRALQKSNLGEFAEADALFAEAKTIPTSDPVQLRLRRNFMALHLVNQRRLDDALAELARPLAAIGSETAAPIPGVIDEDVAAEINSGAPMSRQLGATENVMLTPQEKAAILDAQAMQLRGTVLRLQGDAAGAQTALSGALASLVSIRGGRVASITRLRAQTMAELSSLAEERGELGAAESLLRDGVKLLANEYPSSAALNAANARLAAYFARRGQTEAALTLYREVVATMTASGGSTTGFENLLAPYFELLANQIPTKPALVDDFFLASETLVRPGVADTQAVLARELSGGTDEASALFRQAGNLNRDVERTRIDIARLVSLPNATPEDLARLPEMEASLKRLEAEQIATQSRLSAFPRYRAISTQALTLPDLRAALKPDEGYLKAAVVGNAVYMIFATSSEATAYRTAISAAQLDQKVGALRDTIAKEEDGQLLTFPFNVALARELYVDLLGPADAKLASVQHIVFEPDGALLRLPINLLVTDQASVDTYAARVAKSNKDEFDFTGISWLGARADVSTAVSARGFRDVRQVAPSAASKQYLGFGSNAPVSNLTRISSTRSVARGGIDCNWPIESWNNPISAAELKTAQTIIGGGRANVVTGSEFSDTAVKARSDLSQYRILHFATHGLVTAPRPECPARPALLTSFGDNDSDGLLTFQEIYDLRLDADIVILSACDTAGAATVAATREAGVTTGGGTQLDGLVRAFVGAGGRSVLASHWPLPDDYDATQRLIVGLFDAPAGTSVGEAIRGAQLKLMADANTSHPYYWSGFALVGDGAQPVLRTR